MKEKDQQSHSKQLQKKRIDSHRFVVTMTISTSTRYVCLFLTLIGSALLLSVPIDAYRVPGMPCRADFQCGQPDVQAGEDPAQLLGYCNETRFCSLRHAVGEPCEAHAACLTERCSGGICQDKVAINGPCSINEDCLEGWCNGTCSPLKGRNEICFEDFECRSGRCTRFPRVCEFVIYEREICGKDADCAADRCKKDRGINRCVARKENYEVCVDNGDCLSLRCEQGNCTEPVWLEQPCDEPSDCYSMLCNKEKNMCVTTIAEADTFEEPDPQYGITGSHAAEAVYVRNGTVDITSGTVYRADGTPDPLPQMGGDGTVDSSAAVSLGASLMVTAFSIALFWCA